MERADIAKMGEEIIADFVRRAPGSPEDTYVFRLTSGTSGNGPLFFPVRFGPEDVNFYHGSRRIIAATGTRNFRLKLALFAREDDTPKQSILLVDGHDVEPSLTRLIDDFHPTNMYGFPSANLRVAEYISSATRDGVQKVVNMGEYLTETMQEVMQSQFKHARIAGCYGAAETGGISNETCEYSLTSVFHPEPGVVVEIDNPDEDGIGDIMLSKNIYHDRRIERYKNGDVGYIIEGKCACGAESTFRLLGRRGYDFVRAMGVTLRKEEFDRVAARHLELISDYRAEAYTDASSGAVRGGIQLSIYRGGAVLTEKDCDAIRDVFLDEFYISPTQTLRHAVDGGYFLAPVVVPVAEPFVKKEKDIKLTLRKT